MDHLIGIVEAMRKDIEESEAIDAFLVEAFGVLSKQIEALQPDAPQCSQVSTQRGDEDDVLEF